MDVASGIFQLGNRTVNFWAVVRDEGITLIDAGLRNHKTQLHALLEKLDRPISDVKAVVLTHADIDHIGFAEDLRRDGTPVYIHEADESAAGGKMRPVPKQALLNAWRPSMLTATFEYARDGALKPRFVRDARSMEDGTTLPIPGGPRVLHVPGHSNGSCALLLEDEGVLFTGDALVTRDPLSGRRGPGLLARYDNVDHAQALGSLQKLAATDAALVLPGHGPVWERGVVEAVERVVV
jgi:glyoxylase-like metal-dependent hydrolase (beta-lactamase superfamily II)